MTRSIDVKQGQKPTEDQINEIKAAALKKPEIDEEAPELTLEQMDRYRAAAIKKRQKRSITLSLTEAEYNKAKGFGQNYREILEQLLSLAMSDDRLIGRINA